jgi:pyroglutamyl-peptidase
MKTLLITGFDPFGRHDINPSWEAVQQLPDVLGDFQIHKLNIPTVYEKAALLVISKADAIDADVVLCVGLANGRDAVTPERIGVNIRDARLADNEGRLFSGQQIAEDGPAAYFATVPVRKMAEAIRAAQIPAAVSNTAGTYVCNDVLYTLLHRYDGTSTRCGFIHVPQLPQQGEPCLALEQIVKALTAAINALD